MKDLSGDGKVTKKDVLIGRGVIGKDGTKKMYGGGMTKKYQAGGKICPTCPSPAKCTAAGKCLKAAAKSAGTGMKHGGKVRGCGIAKKGVRKAKMR
jgi:hypothetical protein